MEVTMFHRTLFGALAVAAGFTFGIALKLLNDRLNAPEEKTDDENANEDEEINFLEIKDDEEEDAYPQAVKELETVYPYLKPAFINDLLGQNEELNKKYEPETLIVIRHKAVFDADENEDRFMQILGDSGYDTVKEKTAVTVCKKMYTENGAIISDVLNVANQAQALNGQYIDFETEE